MTDRPNPLTGVDYLARIEGHLKAIRGVLNFFAFVLVLWILGSIVLMVLNI